MKVFRTAFPKIEQVYSINHTHKIMSFGSCFAQNISSKLKASKFNCRSNPFGILYNPLSIAKSIDMIYKGHQFNESDIILDKGLWHSYWHHSEFSKPQKATVLEKIQSNLDLAKKHLQEIDIIIFTFGTSYYYKYKKLGINVGNCHKINPNEFSKHRLTVDEIFDTYVNVISQIKGINPNTKFIFTVSPIRHIKDGFTENTKSKAILHLATEKLVCHFNAAIYFPSYEIIMDDLRGYQFYKKDMLHPNENAIDYVWNYFQNAFFKEETKSLNKSIQKINKAVQHKAFNPESEAHQKFLKEAISKIEKIKSIDQSLNFKKEIDILQEQIKSS